MTIATRISYRKTQSGQTTNYIAAITNEAGDDLENVDLRTLDTERLEALRDEAGTAGDSEMVATIDQVLATTTTTTDLTRIANLLAADLPNLSESEMARLDSDAGLVIQERATCLRYGRADEEIDAVAWLRDGNTLVLWAGNDADPDMNWPVEIPVAVPSR